MFKNKKGKKKTYVSMGWKSRTKHYIVLGLTDMIAYNSCSLAAKIFNTNTT